MLVALNEEEGTRVSSYCIEKRHNIFVRCGKQVILKRGLKVISHFAHKHLGGTKMF